jgi:hypothetical protein
MRIGEITIALGTTLVVLFLSMFMARREAPPIEYRAQWDELTFTHLNHPVVKGAFAPSALDVRVDGGLLPDSAVLALFVRPQTGTASPYRMAPMLTVPGEGLTYRRELKNQDIGRGYDYYFRLSGPKDSTGADTTLMLIPERRRNDSTAAISVFFVGKPESGVLIGHLGTMFAALFCAVLATMGALDSERLAARRRGIAMLIALTVVFLIIGLFILGPRVEMQTYATAWSGFPNGSNWTSTASLIVFLYWLLFAVALKGTLLGGESNRDWVAPARVRPLLFLGAAGMIISYLIPHGLGRM